MKNYVFLLALILITTTSCQDMLDIEPENQLEPDQVYRDRFDADAAVIGVYGKFLGLAERYVILNELRADLMDVTANSDVALRELNSHMVTEGNKWADPRPFYEVILYCNDVLKNFDIMKANNKFTEAEYNERYSDIGALRSWLYFQLVLHWGEVPYITEPFDNIDDLKDINSYPKINLEQMIDNLISYMESLPTLEMYPSNSTLRTTIDGYNTWVMFINKKFFLADLYLWKGRYREAASMYKNVMLTQVPGVDFFDSYRIKFADVTNHNDLSVGYVRYADQNYYSLIDNDNQGWRSMFARSQDGLFNSEWIWVLPFQSRFKQATPFVDLFSNSYGGYLVKPSQVAIDFWNSQSQSNDFPWDERGRFTVRSEGGVPVIKKYTYNYDPLTPLVKDGKWFLSRAALLHLRFCEAANRDEQYRVTWALLNPGGIKRWFVNPTTTDVRLKYATFLTAPYNFDARQTDIPFYRDPWHRHNGIRGRAYMKDVPLNSAMYFNLTREGGKSVRADSAMYYNLDVIDPQGLQHYLEDQLIMEAALELAYEGNRWADLVRVAIRRNDPSFLADKVADKLVKGGNGSAEAVRAKLMSRQNWFLPFK